MVWVVLRGTSEEDTQVILHIARREANSPPSAWTALTRSPSTAASTREAAAGRRAGRANISRDFRRFSAPRDSLLCGRRPARAGTESHCVFHGAPGHQSRVQFGNRAEQICRTTRFRSCRPRRDARHDTRRTCPTSGPLGAEAGIHRGKHHRRGRPGGPLPYQVDSSEDVRFRGFRLQDRVVQNSCKLSACHGVRPFAASNFASVSSTYFFSAASELNSGLVSGSPMKYTVRLGPCACWSPAA